MELRGAARGRVLVAEDSPESGRLMAEILRAEGFEPVVCGDAAAASRELAGAPHVAVILDWVLPDRPGIELCRQIREADGLVPILFVSGRADEASIARGLEAGADDYVAKPVRPSELIARLEAHLRKAGAVERHRHQPAPAVEGIGGEGRDIVVGDVQIDTSARVVTVCGEEVTLGPLEFRLLEYFARNAGIAISREQVLNEVYGYDADISTERVDLLVRRLRAKLGDGDGRAGLLVAVPGYGYRLERRRER